MRLTILLFLGAVLAGCASVPSTSAPQAIGTVERPVPSNLPKPSPGMDPDVLLREFLKATADPANRHLAARQFLTESASNAWDDAGSALLIDHVVFVETRSAEKVSVTMRADILGSLSDVGVFETAEGQLPDPGPIELVKTSDGWRIDRLPNGVFLDWQQFQETYKRNTLYFADPTGKTVVPDPRYVAVSDRDQLATELVSKLLAGPRPEMARTVRNLLAPPLRLRGPVTRADGGKSGIGRGYGGARVDMEKLSTTDPHSRQLLAAQIIWTLARADIRGPYVINADGAPLEDRFAEGWTTSDVAATATDLAARLRRVGTLACRRPLGGDHLVHQRDVGRDVEQLGRQLDSAVDLARRRLDVDFECLLLLRSHHFSPRLIALRTMTSPPVRPGTAPLISSTPFSASTLCTKRLRTVTRSLPIRPAIRVPLNTRAGVAHPPMEPGRRCTAWAP